MNYKSVLSILLLNVICLSYYAQAQDSAASGSSEAKSDAVATKTFCYVCNQNTDPSCGDVYQKKKNHLQECPAGETFCRKIVQYGKPVWLIASCDHEQALTQVFIAFLVEGERSVVRQCAKNLYKPGYEGCYKSAGKSTQHVCTCKPKGPSDQDSCNHSSKVKASIFGMALVALAAAFFY